MLQIVLIRPGSTDFDREGRVRGTLDVPLSEEGNEEVEQIASALAEAGIEKIYCSPCQSSAETAEALAARLGVKWKEIEKLANLDHGLWQGLRLEEIKRKQPRVFKQWQEHPETICPPEGEMLDSARLRLEAVLAKIIKKHKQGVVGIVLPEPLASLAQAYLTHDEPRSDLLRAAAPCGSWLTIGVGIGAQAT